MSKAEYNTDLCMYINISCICYNNTANHLKFGQHLLGLTLRVNPWLWKWSQFLVCFVAIVILRAIRQINFFVMYVLSQNKVHMKSIELSYLDGSSVLGHFKEHAIFLWSRS